MTAEERVEEDVGSESSFDMALQFTFPDMPNPLTPFGTAPCADFTPCLSPPSSYGQGVFGKFKHTDVPKLHAIFFSFFDNFRGTEILFQIPKEIQFIRDRFGLFSAAIIPKDELLNKLVKISYEDFSVIGQCVGLGWHDALGEPQLISLEHPEYNRGVLLFNMCFVVMKESVLDCMYEPLVQKIAEYLIELEQECLYISTPKTRNQLPNVMRSIFYQLNNKGECVLPVEGTMTTIYLKLCPSYRGTEPPKVALYMVPMLTRNVACTDPHIIAKMDVLSQKIIPKIDGVRCVKEIACEVDIDADIVSRCIRNLVFYECVSLVPLFLYQNCYVSTEKLHDFYKNKSRVQECLEFVRIRKENNELGPVPKFNDVFRLYLSLTCGFTMDDWCIQYRPRQFFVDERRLIQFGMYHKFVRKLSVYPVATVVNQERIFTLCDGTNALEDLAVLYSVPPKDMFDYLKKSRSFQFISK